MKQKKAPEQPLKVKGTFNDLLLASAGKFKPAKKKKSPKKG